ncbi:DUF4355 domain-containing protein [Lachnospiraceae bacterium 54-11]
MDEELNEKAVEGDGLPATEDGIAGNPAGFEEQSIEAQRQELEKERQQLRLEYLRLDTIQFLKECELPETLAGHVMADDFEKTKKIILELKAAFDNAVQQQVVKRLAGKSPRGGNGDFSNNDLTGQVRRALA